ncbi:MAG: hypothetical protein GY855_08900 [candidate division Zixibacteria bacterium]|nr:hypothetical protein [candidate division Zixibacteria bacterium]
MSISKFIKDSLETEELEKKSEQDNELSARIDFDTAYHSMVCGGCSCLCDDISYFLNKGKIVRTLNLCEVAMKRLRTVSSGDVLPPFTSDALQDQIKIATNLIKKNGPCLVLGAAGLGESGFIESRNFAKSIKGLFLPWLFPDMRRFYEQVKQFGYSTALLDEVRDHADIVFMWRCDPLDTHHRHLSRYSLFARGRYTERGHSDRNFVAIASEKPVLEPLCQQYFEMNNEKDVQFILSLMEPPQAEPPDHRDFSLLRNAIQRCFYIAIFVDPVRMTDAALEVMFEWSAAVNTEGKKRIVILPLWAGGANIAGFTQASLEIDSAPWGADFTESDLITSPSANWETLAQKISSVIMIESGPDGGHRMAIPEPLAGKPKVIITPFKQNPVEKADVVIPVALPGIETEDRFLRADGLPLKALRLPDLTVNDYPAAEQVFRKLTTEVIS